MLGESTCSLLSMPASKGSKDGPRLGKYQDEIEISQLR